MLLLGSFFAAAASAQVMLPQFGISITLAIICAVFAIAWLTTVVVAVSGKDNAAGVGALTIATMIGGLLLASAGGPASPFALLVIAPGLEAWWVQRTRKAAVAGAISAVGILLVHAAVTATSLVAPAVASGWHWFLPAAYVLSVVLRVRARLGAGRDLTAGEAGDALEDCVDAVVLRVADAGDVAHVSSRARTLLGLQPELLLGAGLFERIHVADRVAWLTALADVREGAPERDFELKLRLPAVEAQPTPDNYRQFAVRLVRVGGAGQTVVFLRDNGQMAALREDLAASREAAESHGVAKSRFLASVSHELRTPLNAIIGFSDMMLHGMCGAFEDRRQKEYVGLIRESGNHLLGVVNAILDVSKIESGAYDVTPEHFRFAEAIEMCRDMMTLQAQAKKVTVDIRVAAAVGEVVADRRSVRQIVINLLSNAIKFTPEGGRVVVAASRVGSMLHFSVSDNGIGIAEDDLARLGQPFTQVQNDYTRQFDGAGLGLSLVKGLVRLHRGAMTIESAPGEGTAVTISLHADGPVEEAGADVHRIEPAISNGEINGTLRKIA